MWYLRHFTESNVQYAQFQKCFCSSGNAKLSTHKSLLESLSAYLQYSSLCCGCRLFLVLCTSILLPPAIAGVLSRNSDLYPNIPISLIPKLLCVVQSANCFWRCGCTALSYKLCPLQCRLLSLFGDRLSYSIEIGRFSPFCRWSMLSIYLMVRFIHTI